MPLTIRHQEIFDGEQVTFYSQDEAKSLTRRGNYETINKAASVVQKIRSSESVKEWFEMCGTALTPEVNKALDGIFADIATQIKKMPDMNPQLIIDRVYGPISDESS